MIVYWLLVCLITMIVWIAVIYEFNASRKENMKKVMPLMGLGTLLTVIIIIAFFQNFPL